MSIFKRIKVLALLLAPAVAGVAGAAELSARVSAEAVYLGDDFRLEVTLDGAKAPGATPQIENAAGCSISAPQPRNQSSRSVSIINGKRSEHVVERTSWIYAVRPEQAGVLTLGEASLEVDGRRLTTSIPPVRVLGAEPQPHVKVSLSASRNVVLVEEVFDVVLDVVIVRLPGEHAEINPMAGGENAPHLDIPFFVEGAVSGCDFARPLDGFLNGLLSERPESGGFRVNNYTRSTPGSPFDFFGSFGNRTPAVFHLARTATDLDGKPAWRYQLTFPFKATDEGTCRFPAVRFKGHVFVSDNGSAPRRHPVFAVSELLTVSVAPPPAEGRPASFIGSLGTRMEAAVSLDVQSCSEGDPIQLTLEITGDQTLGNMKTPRIFDNPLMSERFRRYGDVPSERLPAGMRYVYKVRPIQSGTIEVPALELAFFNTETRQYETIETAPVPLRVNPAAQLDPDAIYGVATNVSRASLSIEAELHPSGLAMTAPTTAPMRRSAMGGAFFAAFLAPPSIYALVVAASAFWRRRKTLGETLKRGSATGRATRRILKAKTPQAVMEGVGAFLRDKFGEDGASFTPGDVRSILERRGVDGAVVDEVVRRLQAVFDSGFTPGGDPAGVVKAHRHRLAELLGALKVVLFACLLGGLASAADAAAPASFIWRQAASAASQAREPRDFREAAMLYREIIESDGADGAALYNYGTLLLLAGCPSASFDALSRAEALLGATPEIENNLAIAFVELRKAGSGKDAPRQGVDAAAELPWYRVPLFWHYRVPMQVREDWLAVAWGVLWAGLLLRRLRARRLGMVLTAAGLLASALLLTSVLASHRVLTAPLPDVPEATAQEGVATP
ncbi:MAG: BatD family protein [Kiritimatiellia bacterium]